MLQSFSMPLEVYSILIVGEVEVGVGIEGLGL